MNPKRIVVTLLCLLSFHNVLLALPLKLSREDALEIAKRQFQDKDVDYLIRLNTDPIEWIVFVDAEPMKGWCHECYYLHIPRISNIPVSDIVPSVIEKSGMPPISTEFEPLEVKNRFGEYTELRPHVRAENSSKIDNEYASRTYALIISGGLNKISNHFRYWNDCSFIYQTLVNKFGVSKSHIFPIMSDGEDPEEDMEIWNYTTFISQPLDLDLDGNDEHILAATKTNIRNTLDQLTTKMQKDDHLLIYVIDHGATCIDDVDKNVTHSTICLWTENNMPEDSLKNRDLKDFELANMLKPLISKGVNINVVLGQCFSGGFIDDLIDMGCVVATASEAHKGSWACKDIPYDEFVYHWTCAINEADHRGKK